MVKRHGLRSDGEFLELGAGERATGDLEVRVRKKKKKVRGVLVHLAPPKP